MGEITEMKDTNGNRFFSSEETLATTFGEISRVWKRPADFESAIETDEDALAKYHRGHNLAWRASEKAKYEKAFKKRLEANPDAIPAALKIAELKAAGASDAEILDAIRAL